MRKLLIGLTICTIGLPAYADVIVDATFSGQVYAYGAVPGGGSGGEIATGTITLTFDETGDAVPASQIFFSMSGIPDVQPAFGLDPDFIHANSFDISSDGAFLGGSFAFATPTGFEGPSVALDLAGQGSYSDSSGDNPPYFEEYFGGYATITQVTPVPEP